MRTGHRNGNDSPSGDGWCIIYANATLLGEDDTPDRRGEHGEEPDIEDRNDGPGPNDLSGGFVPWLSTEEVS